jgi:hypothetical protein
LERDRLGALVRRLGAAAMMGALALALLLSGGPPPVIDVWSKAPLLGHNGTVFSGHTTLPRDSHHNPGDVHHNQDCYGHRELSFAPCWDRR